MRKKIRQALKTVGGPHSHRNKLASLNNLSLILIATGFILFNSLDSKCTSYILSYSLHHQTSLNSLLVLEDTVYSIGQDLKWAGRGTGLH